LKRPDESAVVAFGSMVNQLKARLHQNQCTQLFRRGR